MNKKNTKLLDSFGKFKDVNFNFDKADRYFRNRDKSNSFQAISDKTCNDLDFNELFTFLDRTTSKVGQQYLYNKLRTIPSDNSRTAPSEKLITAITENKDLRLSVLIQLDKLTRENAYYITSLFQDEHIKPPSWFFIIPLLSLTSLLSVLTLTFIPQSIFLLIPVVIVNLVIHFWNKRNLNEYVASVPQLLILNDVAKKLVRLDIPDEIKKDTSTAIKVIDKIRNKMSFFKLEAKMESDIQIAVWAAMELIKSVFLLEPLLLFGVLKVLDTRRSEIEKLYAFVGEVDALVSVASLRCSTDYCIPVIEESGRVYDAEDICHPLIPDCVANSISLKNKSVLLTGSNMSGKTSFIRTIGVNALTALTINTCFAKQIRLSRMKIFSAIRISDDLMNDKSYYFEEVLTIKEMVEKSSQPGLNLFLLDEIFKGTNTIERISAGKAVLSYLSTNNNIVFVSTHDIELTELLNETYDLYHFSEQVDNRNVAFDFRLKEGRLTNRNAIRILQINDYPEKIISEAISLSQELDKIAFKRTTS